MAQLSRLTWDEGSQAEVFIRSQPEGTRIRLVGHSYGGDTAAQIAARLGAAGRPLDMLVTVDPVGRGTSTGFFERVHQGTRRWINVNATGESSFQRSNIWAGFGGSWDYAPMGHADEFLNAPVPHVGFSRMMDALLANGRTIRLEVLAR
jgi:pimeloyl-ACP methyl ester carboxylesterase